jgi:hypothetical protein
MTVHVWSLQTDRVQSAAGYIKDDDRGDRTSERSIFPLLQILTLHAMLWWTAVRDLST